MARLSAEKGQVTAFIIIGIALLAVFAFYFSIQRAERTGLGVPETSEISSAMVYLDLCAESASKKSLALIGFQGGKPILEEPYHATPFINTNYLYDRGAERFESLEGLRKNLENEVEKNIEDCFDNFALPGATLEKGKPNASVEFTGTSTQVNINYPVEIKKDGKTQKIEKLQPVIIGVRMKLIYETAKNITLMRKEYPYAMSFVPLLDTGMNITADITPETQMFLLVDPLSEIDNQPYGFLFATRTQ